MERQLERCWGLDVHKETIAACVRIGGQSGRAVQYVQTFRTTAAELLVLRDWLAAHGVTHVAMESTGVYWKPVFYALESEFTCLLVNAAHIKPVPGRKTDVHDVLAQGTTYREFGGDYNDRRHTQHITRRAIRLLEGQDYRVILEPAA